MSEHRSEAAARSADGSASVVELRPMRWWHIASVIEIELALFVDDAWSDAMFWSELAERDTRHYVVAADGDDVIGYAGLCVYGPDQAFVQTIAVASEWQGRRIGTTLLEHLVAESLKRGCVTLDLEVRADNPVAIALYEKHGFTRIALRRRYYQPSNTDAVIMRRVAS